MNTDVRRDQQASASILTIDRQESGNSLSLSAAEALSEAIGDAEQQAGVRAIVITGAGDRFFCAGGDLKAYRAIENSEQLENTFGRVRLLLDQIENSPLPVIAAINGYALGGGLELALACDLRIAAQSAVVGMPQANLGLIPGWNGAERLVEAVGRSRATHLLLTGERLDAARAEAIGLIDFVAHGPVLQAAIDYANRLYEAAPLAIGAGKRAIISALRQPGPATRELTAKLFERLWFSKDHREAEAAFAEKRKPRFNGD